jgi:hypothetical protein
MPPPPSVLIKMLNNDICLVFVLPNLSTVPCHIIALVNELLVPGNRRAPR